MFTHMKIRTKLLITFWVMSIGPFVILGFIALWNANQAISTLAFGQLESLREVKKNQVMTFLEERQSNMQVLIETVATHRQAGFEKLRTVQENKKAEVEGLFHEYLNDITVISKNPAVLEALNAFKTTSDGDGNFDRETYDFYEGLKHGNALRVFQEEYGYYDMLLLTVEGTVVYSLNRETDLAKTSLTMNRSYRRLPQVFSTDWKQSRSMTLLHTVRPMTSILPLFQLRFGRMNAPSECSC